MIENLPVKNNFDIELIKKKFNNISPVSFLSKKVYVDKNELLELLNKFDIKILKQDLVFDYLEKNPETYLPLKNLIPKIRECFQKETKIALDLDQDPEIDNNSLVFYVKNDSENLIEVINNFRDILFDETFDSNSYIFIYPDIQNLTD